MTPAPNAAYAAEPPAGRGGRLPVLARDPWVVVRRVLRVLDPVWPDPAPGAATGRDELDARLLDHLAG